MYFLRLEAIWILINLAYVNKREMAVICASIIPVASYISEDKLMADLNSKTSIILSKVDNLIREKMNQGCKDIKTLNMMFHFLSNCIATGKDFARKVIQETCYLDVLLYIEENVDMISAVMMENIAVINRFLASHKFQLPDQHYKCILALSLKSIRLPKVRTVQESLRTLDQLASARKDNIE